MNKDGLVAVFLSVMLIFSAVSIFPKMPSAAASAVWYGGAESLDSSALPNVGVRAVIDVVNQPNIPAGSYVLPWISDELSNGVWLQAGYYVQQGSAPMGFMQIWNLSSGNILQTKYPTVTIGPHTFSIYLKSGTTWDITYDGQEWTSYDAGTSVSSSDYPVYSLVEMQGSSVFPFNTVDFPTAMQVQKTVGGSWAVVQTAAAYGSAYGTQGQLQNNLLSPNSILVGTSIPMVLAGTTLWNVASAAYSPPSVAITNPNANSWASKALNVTVSASASGTGSLSQVNLYVDNISAGAQTSIPYTFSLNLTSLVSGQHTLKAVAVDNANNQASTSVNFNVDNTPPTITVPSSITMQAASLTGTVVLYNVSASDNDGLIASGPICTPSSGSTFQLGTTTVSCTAKDAAGNTATAAFPVTVLAGSTSSTTANLPTLHLPSAVTAQATSSSGAAVIYTATATSSSGASLPVNCDLASGSTFAITTTNVACTAVDSNGNTASGSFSVTVVDSTPPAATIASPTPGTKVIGIMTITVQASDNTGIGSVAIYIDGKLKTTDTAAPYSYNWNTKSFKSGIHTIMAIVTDLYGNHVSVTSQVAK